LTLDFVAKRYGVLPSMVLRSGDSVDYKIADLAVRYENWSREAAERKSKGLPPPAPKIQTQDLQAMLDQVRGK
jgi:hypothetical protein